jgi:hypothetical protein
MKVARDCCATALFFLAGFSASAVAAPLDAYKGGLGKWNCDVTSLGSGKTYKATIENTVEFDGNTYVEKYTEFKSADHPTPWSAIFIMSYDEASGRWVRNGVDNSGGRNAASASGWQGKTWVWENDGVNIVIDDKGRNSRTFAVDVKDGTNVKRVAEAACKRI